MKTKRTDAHRPGAIIPADYELFDFFAYPGAYEPGFNLEILSSPLVREHGYATGSASGCQICGRGYRFGALFRHTPTGKFLCIGHECARKYEILADFAAFDARFEAHKRRNAAQIQAAKNKHDIERFLDNNDGLREALACGHRITNELAERLTKYKSLSFAQMNLAFKLHADTFCPARPPEVNVPAPEGRITVRGKIVSVKEHVSDFGECWKMTVKVATDVGTWLCWGTAPASLLDDACRENRTCKGLEVEFTATLKRGREAHFAIFKRPTNCKIVGGLDPAPALEPRPGVAGNVCAKLNADAGYATKGHMVSLAPIVDRLLPAQEALAGIDIAQGLFAFVSWANAAVAS